jgi:hypothetical protein
MTEPTPYKVYIPLVDQEQELSVGPSPNPSPPPIIEPGPSPSPSPTSEPPPVATPSPEPPASQKIAIDPITRIEGHLRLEVQIEDGYVVNAWSAGMMFRGIELLLPGRDPRDAWVFTQRICGV